jgi:hypothetical protein
MLLAQTFDLLKGLTIELTNGVIPAGNIVHNRNELPAEMVPGLILLDADEVATPIPHAQGRALRPGTCLMRMTPEIYVVLDVRKPQNTKVGDDLNLARAAILNCLLHDPTLQTITGSNGLIQYDGCVTDLARNRTMKGQMGLSITFTYPFIPDELSPL